MKALQRLAALKARFDFRSQQVRQENWMLWWLLAFAPLIMLSAAIKRLLL